MSRAALVFGVLTFLSQPVLPGSVSLNSSLAVQSSTAMTPNSSDSFSGRTILIYDPTQTPSPVSAIPVPGVPSAGENNSLANSFNSASYTVTAANFGPTLSSYAFMGEASLSDASQILLGFGPLFTSSLGLNFTSIGNITVSSSFDAQLTSAGPNDASVLNLLYQGFGVGTAALSLVVDVRGVGQATVQQNQISASGTDYTLAVSLANGEVDYIQVSGGLITAESIAPTNTLSLPAIGASGNFAIPLALSSINIPASDFEGTSGTLGIQSTVETFNDNGTIPFTIYPAPEPSTLILCLSGCAAVFLRSKLRRSV